jgi:hypothetical protein
MAQFTEQGAQDNSNIAYDYTLRFYPRFFTWIQAGLHSANTPDGNTSQATVNHLAGPVEMGPECKVVVAFNDDTIYTTTFLDLSTGPEILTLPTYPNIYSILQLDVFGNVFKTPLSISPPSDGGSYGLVGPGYTGSLPTGVTKVELPYDSSVFILRVDKYSPQGENQIEAARTFQANLLLQSLNAYDPTCQHVQCGKTFIAPVSNYAPSVKLMADEGLRFAPEAFLTTLQEAMASPSTTPLAEADHALIHAFNVRFYAAKQLVDRDSSPLSDLLRGAQAAHVALINRWQSHRGPTNWIHFNNVGHWGTNYLDRAALTEYIQFGNDRTAAYYADAFVDGGGVPLNGGQFAYTITFAQDQLPQAKRFWSMTAYTPEYIELVPNPLNKYVVASYTPGLVTAADGSITIYVQAAEPAITSRIANWLPVPPGPFSLMFRVYGPEGTARAGTYVPPKIHRVGLHA